MKADEKYWIPSCSVPTKKRLLSFLCNLEVLLHLSYSVYEHKKDNFGLLHWKSSHKNKSQLSFYSIWPNRFMYSSPISIEKRQLNVLLSCFEHWPVFCSSDQTRFADMDYTFSLSFLVACTRPYRSLCRSVCRSVITFPYFLSRKVS